MAGNVRIDKWLWAIRVFKTRSQATEACRKGHVTIEDFPVKPSREIQPGQIVKVKKMSVCRSLKVIEVTGKRMSAKLVPDFVEDVTPSEEFELLKTQKDMNWISREKGSGRPTKKERRDLDEFFNL